MADPDVRLDKLEERLRTQEQWAAGQEGETNEKWRQNDKWQSDHDGDDRAFKKSHRAEMIVVNKRLGVVEKKIIWLCSGVGMASGILGSTGGGWLSSLFGG